MTGIPPIPAEVQATIRRMWSFGVKRQDIARAVGVSPTTVTKYCRDLPKPVEHRGRPKRERT